MNPLDLIPLPYRLAACVAAAAVLALAAFVTGWTVQGWRLEGSIRAQEAVHERTVAAAATRNADVLRRVQEERGALAASLALVDADKSEELRRFTHENDTLRADVGSGRRVVRINAVCNLDRGASLPATAAGSRVDSGDGAVLGVEAGQLAIGIRADAARIAGKLDACQAALGCITGQRACPAPQP